MQTEEARVVDNGYKISLIIRSHRQSGGDSKNAPSNLSVQMQITMEKIKGSRNYLFISSQKNSWKQWYKIDTSLFFNMPLVPTMPVAS